MLACEPAGHRWKPLVVTARACRIPVVCVQPLLGRRAREGEDFTRNRSGLGDAVIIARLTAELRCYVPYLPEGPWARLRHLGARRDGLLRRVTAAREQLRDLLECAWPAVLETAAEPLESMTWRAALTVSADPAVIAAMSEEQFLAALRDQLRAVGGQTVWRRIAVAVHAAAADPGGIAAGRSAILERAAFACQDWMTALAALADIEARMVGVLGELDLIRLVTTIPGLTAVGAPRPATRPATTAREPGSSTRGSRRRQTSPASTVGGPAPPAVAGRCCAPPPGGRSGARCAATGSTPPGTSTSPPVTPAGSPMARPAPRSPPRCCGSCSW